MGKMPHQYDGIHCKYIQTINRSAWRSEDLKNAINAIAEEQYPVPAASRMYIILERTVRCKLANNCTENTSLEHDQILSNDVERKLTSNSQFKI